MRYQWWIHGHINFVLLSSSAFCDLYDELIQPDEPTEAYQTLQGFHTRSVDASRGLWALSRTAKASPALRELFATMEPSEVLAALDATDEGRAFHAELDDYLFEFGWRHDAVYDLADIPWREDPSIPLGQHRRADRPRRRARILRPSTSSASPAVSSSWARLREKLADDPEQLAKFDELYEAARYSFPLTEDHAFYIDQLGISVFRRFALAVGDRLVEKGVIDAADDVFFLYRDELVEALRSGGDRRALVGRAAGQHGEGRAGGPADRAGHAASPARGARPVHGRPRVPAAGHGARRRTTRTRTCSGPSPGRPAPTPVRPGSCARWPRPSTNSRTARSWCAR